MFKQKWSLSYATWLLYAITISFKCILLCQVVTFKKNNIVVPLIMVWVHTYTEFNTFTHKTHYTKYDRKEYFCYKVCTVPVHKLNWLQVVVPTWTIQSKSPVVHGCFQLVGATIDTIARHDVIKGQLSKVGVQGLVHTK